MTLDPALKMRVMAQLTQEPSLTRRQVRWRRWVRWALAGSGWLAVEVLLRAGGLAPAPLAAALGLGLVLGVALPSVSNWPGLVPRPARFRAPPAVVPGGWLN